ncbi:MAG: ammonia-forming cytochrome c nitrite reductase [Bacteroidales bacterium]|nr:ammonia-forming cytochrome c nitrite reductase [Bacteroidales bacterium]
MENIRNKVERKPWLGWAIFIVSLLVVFLIGLFSSSIMERRAEAIVAFRPQVKYADNEPRNEIWGENFPRQFQSYQQTSDTSFKSKYNGNAMIDMLEVDPRLVILWAGYAFSKDYKQSRGHFYAVEDVNNTLRTGAPKTSADGPMPATCWTCKSPDVPRLMEKEGAAGFYTGTWASKGAEIVNHIGCADCHDAKTMNLRISRPALVEAYQNMGKDIKQATHQEMRSLVCAQCHVEYYFDKKKVEGANYLTFPWHNGFTVEAMEQYYDAIHFSDWTHALSKAPMLKAQHPDYELHSMGVHADRGVSCADCHMPYTNEGGQKFTSHKMSSPLSAVSSSCQVCHREETDKLIANVYERQTKVIEIRDELEKQLVMCHLEAKAAWDAGATEESMKDILQGIRKAQWRWDYAAASHGAAFHAPLETSRVIANGLVFAQETRISLARLLIKLGVNEPLTYPDIDTKAKAQTLIRLDMEKLHAEKAAFLENVVPQWKKEAAAREATYPLTRNL